MLVAKNIKKVYSNKQKDEIDDVEYINDDENMVEVSTLFKNYRSNVSSEGQNKYSELYSSLNPYMTPCMNPFRFIIYSFNKCFVRL